MGQKFEEIMARTSWEYTGSTSPWAILLECNQNNPSLQQPPQTFSQYTQSLKQHYTVSLSPPKNLSSASIIIHDDDYEQYEPIEDCETPKSPNLSQHRRSRCTNLQHINNNIADNESLSGIIKIKEYEDYIEEHNGPSKRKKKKKSKKHKKKNVQKEAPLLITESNSCDLWDSYIAISSTPTSQIQTIATHKKQKKQMKASQNCVLEHKNSLLDPKYRKLQREKKDAENLSFTGFKIRTKRRYRIDDGRIGICMFRGRTAFGKPLEDWIGIMIEHGNGEHNGTVDGHSYFRCAHGKGIMVRPQRIVQDLGMPNGSKLSQKVIGDYPYEEIERVMNKKGLISQ